MSTTTYTGWSLFDQVLIVAKKIQVWDTEAHCMMETDDWQGYVVDPANKKMHATATAWAETCRSKYDENGKYAGYDRTPGEEFLYDNDGFVLELKETAGGSSQGGKLSFWNCWVTAPDGKRFKIGIAADLLLELLTQTSFDSGKCLVPLCFARRAEGVGMLNKCMKSYQQALADMQKKKDVKSKKTSKHVIGHAYTALRAADAYVADIYVWYQPVCEPTSSSWGGRTYEKFTGIKKLDKPKHLKWFASLNNFEPGKRYKVSELRLLFWELPEKLPARIDSGDVIDYDLSIEEVIKNYNDKNFIDEYEQDLQRNATPSFSTCDLFGLSTNSEEYELPEDVRKVILAAGYKIVD